jgi:hypothetical protein
MTSKVFALDTKPGIQRDGTVFDKVFYNDGRWVRFQRGRPRKIGGYSQISNQLSGPSRGIWVDAKNGFNSVYNGYADGLQKLEVDNNGVGSGYLQITLNNFTPSPLNLWQFDGFYDVGGAGVATIVAHPGKNLAQIDSTANTPVLIGSISGSSMSQIGVFTDSVTTTNGNSTVTLATANILIGAGQTITGAGIPAGTTVVSVSGTNVVMSANATASATVTATFNNNVEVSGGVVVLHPYVFVFGNNGLIKNCSAGNAQDWVSADANEVNVATGKIVQGLPVRGGSNSPSGLFWSLDSLVRVSYAPQSLGVAGTNQYSQPTFWRYDIISSQSSILSSQSVIEYDGIYYWCGVDRFLMYNGVVKEIPNSMNQNWFFDNLNYNQRQKVWATKVPRYGEIWWFYPRGDATECTDVIIYNIREQTWYDAGSAIGAKRSAGYFSQVISYPIWAGWETTIAETVYKGSFNLTNGSDLLLSNTYITEIYNTLVITGTGIPDGTKVQTITSSGIKTFGTLTGGSGYTDGTYNDVPLTGGDGFGATADIVVSGGAVTSVTLVLLGAVYQVGNSLSADDADLGGGGGMGFSIDVSDIWTQIIKMTQSATMSATETLTFLTQEGLYILWQHEYGTDEVKGQVQNAIESYFETSDLGWVGGGPSEPAMVGQNNWVRIERIEPDFIQSGEMQVYVTGRPYADEQDVTSQAYLYQPGTGKIDMREQRRELRLKFRSDVQGGDYQMGRVIVSADFGDVRGYSGT